MINEKIVKEKNDFSTFVLDIHYGNQYCKEKLDVYAEDFDQDDKDIIERNYDEIIARVLAFEETIKNETDLTNRFIMVIDEYLN